MQSLKDLWHGITHHPAKTVGYCFTAFSVLFTIVKGVDRFIPSIKIEGPFALWLAIIISLAFGLWKVWKPSKAKIQVANCNTVIEVLFGDLFEQEGIRIISVNEFFDSKLGRPVSDKSLHGIFLQKCFGGYSEPFDKQVEAELAIHGIQGTPIEKIEGKKLCYPIGTTAMIQVNHDRYLVFAFAKSEPKTCKAYSNVEWMWASLYRMWQRARDESGGHSVNLPLVGGGLSGLGLPTRDLLNLIILSVITETKSREITQVIRIVLHRSRFEDVDLREIAEHWKE
ncbi:macro domain-containing protein [Terracidiphilus gabretensis]|uniref:macro domain-containing protein n=1 Tax=Terracidiphilus gabretensis TaxID=1577687 RepID=UPI000AAFE765|nr:macro domain-containing protein [Terracidiphilus gabretensis]